MERARERGGRGIKVEFERGEVERPQIGAFRNRGGIDMVRIAMVRARYRRNLMAWACGESVESPTRKLLRSDGDHAIGTRVARFLIV